MSRSARRLSLALAGLLFYSLATSAPAQAQVSTKIYGGKDVPASTWPWLVGVLDVSRENIYRAQFCGGNLIAPNWVLTAAHCVDDKPPEGLTILVNEVALSDTLPPDPGSGPLIIAVSGVHIHPNWNSSTLNHDFALLRLAQDVAFTPVNLIDQALFDALIASAELNNDEVVAAGWGTISDTGTITTDYPDTLQSVRLDYVPWATCRARYGSQLTDKMVCANEQDANTIEPDDTGDSTPLDPSGEDSCTGDSGGPLFLDDPYQHQGNVQWLIGVTSWGEDGQCGNANYPGVYAAPLAVLDWIEQTVNTYDPSGSLVDIRTALSSNATVTSPGSPLTLTLTVYNDSLENNAQSLKTVITHLGTVSLNSTSGDMFCSPLSATQFSCLSLSPTLAPGAVLSTPITVTHTGGEETLTFTALTTQDENDYRGANNETQQQVIYSTKPDPAILSFSATQTGIRDGVFEGDITLTVSNNSATVSADNAVVTVTLDPNLTLVSRIPEDLPDCAFAASQLQCNLGNLAAEQTHTLTFSASAEAAGTYPLSADITASNGDSDMQGASNTSLQFVTPPPPPDTTSTLIWMTDSDSSSGSHGPAALLGLLLAGLWRRYKANRG